MPDLELHCAQTTFSEDGIIVCYTDPKGNTIDRDFKSRYLAWLKERDKNIIYIGDGLSDLEPARLADHVFAKGHLLELLSTKPVVRDDFSNFYDILQQVRLL